MSENYKVLSVGELNSIQNKKQSSVDTFYQIEYNKAFVTLFKDGTATLLPGGGLGEGMFFSNKDELQKILATKTFPTKGDGSFWELEKKRILNFQNEIPYYCENLSSIFGLHVEINLDTSYLKHFSNIINQKFAQKKIARKTYNYLAIYIAEILRKKTGGKWKLSPKYTLNLYYIPEIVREDKFCSPWSSIIGNLESFKYMPIDLTKIIDDANRYYSIGGRTYDEIQ